MVDTVHNQETRPAARGRTGHPVVVGLMLVSLTVAVWFTVLPSEWLLRPADEANTYSTAVPMSGIVIVAALLVALSVLSGVLGHPWLPLVTVALPAFALWCWQAMRAEAIGANLWVIGALMLFPVAFGGAALAGWIGSLLRRTVVAPARPGDAGRR
ncbi:MAG TPA: hypothetical protein VGD67_11625 [Pseudonocardiaceae bacterium]